jgi:methylated-DNA-[protein]-cysteine S-methyltransferase
MRTTTLSTPVGPFTLIVDGDAVLASGFTADTAELLPQVHRSLRPAATDAAGSGGPDAAGGTTGAAGGSDPAGTAERAARESAVIEQATKAVAAYFDGDLTAIDAVPVRQRSDGAFLGLAWQVLREVPAGEPLTYSGFAARTGRPTAVRAAAQACARNAAALFVPCHRVVPSGSGGGYRWGVPVKTWLLAHERRVHESDS